MKGFCFMKNTENRKYKIKEIRKSTFDKSAKLYDYDSGTLTYTIAAIITSGLDVYFITSAVDKILSKNAQGFFLTSLLASITTCAALTSVVALIKNINGKNEYINETYELIRKKDINEN